MNKNIILAIVAVTIVGAGSFYGGMQYQRSQAPRLGSGNFQRQMSNGQGTAGMQGSGTGDVQPVSGEILSIDDTGFTVKMPDGSTKIVILSDSPSINKTSGGSKSDLKTGDQVTAFGTANSDGSVTAQSVAIGGGFFGRMGAGQSPQN